MADPSMALPMGKTCSACAHYRRCVMLFGCSPSAATCDWAPSRFVEKAPPPPGRAEPRCDACHFEKDEINYRPAEEHTQEPGCRLHGEHQAAGSANG